MSEWMPDNPCDHCKCHKSYRPACATLLSYAVQCASQKKLLEYLIAHPSTLSDARQFVFIDKLKDMLEELK